METIVRIGLDTSKSVFQLHGVDGTEQPVLRRKLRRGQVLEFFRRLPPAPVALEACGASHYWSRELQSPGHEVAMIPPQYVKPYAARESDAADEEAICEAATLVLASSEHEAIAKGNAIHGLAGLGNFSFSDCGERLARLGS